MSGRALLSVEADMASIRRSLGDVRSDTQALAASVRADFARMGDAATQTYRKIRREAGRAAEALAGEERRATATAEESSRRRQQLATVEANYRANAFRGNGEAMAREERHGTEAVSRESRRRIAVARREVAERKALLRELASATAGAAGAVAGGVSAAGRAVLSEREGAARRERELDNSLVQTVPGGASRREVEASRSYIMEQIRRRGLNADTTIEALGVAQSSANALGGATPEARRAAIDATLNDVQTASLINPNNINGMVRFGAIVRNQVRDPAMQDRIMRASAGISFAGSVETDEALRSGLPGLMRSISSNTANLRPGQNRDEVIGDTITDFLAQVQTVAASGGAVGVTSNRMTALRTTLSNADTQNRLGQAFARRARHGDMTPEQRTLFEQAFTRGRDGRYTMNADLVNSPSNAARFFGQQFGNDATAVANFLGPRGGGGKRQLVNRPEVGLLTSYFGTTTNSRGENVRQYDAVNDLRRATITPEQMGTLREIRAGEDATNLTREENARSAALGDRSSWFVQAAHAAYGWAAANPLLAASGAGAAGGGAKAAHHLFGLAQRGVGALTGASKTAAGAAGSAGFGTTLGTLIGGAGLVAGSAANTAAVLTGTSATGREIGPLERLARATAGGIGPAGAAVGMADLANRGGAAAGHALQAAFSNEQVQTIATALARAVAGAVKMSPHDRAVIANQRAIEYTRPAP